MLVPLHFLYYCQSDTAQNEVKQFYKKIVRHVGICIGVQDLSWLKKRERKSKGKCGWCSVKIVKHCADDCMMYVVLVGAILGRY